MAAAKMSLAGVTTEDLIDELQKRDGVVCSIWNVEDAKGIVAEDDDCEGMSDDQIERTAKNLLEQAARSLRDVLGSRGNECLADYFAGHTDEVLADVAKAPTV